MPLTGIELGSSWFLACSAERIKHATYTLPDVQCPFILTDDVEIVAADERVVAVLKAGTARDSLFTRETGTGSRGTDLVL